MTGGHNCEFPHITGAERLFKMTVNSASRIQDLFPMEDRFQSTLRAVGSDTEVSLESDEKDYPAFMQAIATLMALSQRNVSGPKVLDKLDQSLSQLVQVTEAGNAAVLITDDASQELAYALVHKEQDERPLMWQRIPVGHGIAHWVRETGRLTVINNSRNDERYFAAADGQLDDDTQSLMVGPLRAGRRTLGVVQVVNKRGGELFTSSDEHCLGVFCHFAGRLLRVLAHRGG